MSLKMIVQSVQNNVYPQTPCCAFRYATISPQCYALCGPLICVGVLVRVCVGICDGVCVGETEKKKTKDDIFKLKDNNYHVILQFQNFLQNKN